MDPALYKDAVEGNINPFESYQTRLNQLLTPNKNTVLHVYLEHNHRAPESTDFVDKILGMCPTILLQDNIKGETPLHLAARYGDSNTVKVLIDRAKGQPTNPESGVTEAKKMLRMTTCEKDTALHMAARNIQSRVVEILTKEDPDFSYSANDHGETPLYIATIIGYLSFHRTAPHREKVISDILKNCISVDYGGPNGRTALHAAIMRRDNDTARKLLEKEKNLTKRTDHNGWSPLHYAAYFSYPDVKLLLEDDVSVAYIVDIDMERTALHIAAIQGNLTTMTQIISWCPACCDLVDNRGWNALHYAVASKNWKVFEDCLKIPELDRLKTEKDDKGNTPFHLIAALKHKLEDWTSFLYEMMVCGLNKQNLSVEDILNGNLTDIQQKEILESIEDVGSGPFGRTLAEMKRASFEDYIGNNLIKINRTTPFTKGARV